MEKETTEIRNPRTKLLDRLWEYQSAKSYISDEDVKTLSAELDISRVEIEGVISFYHFFHRKPAGKHTIYLNSCVISKFKGYDRIREAFERETGASIGGIEPSGQFGLFNTACIGLSDTEPAALINFYPFTRIQKQDIELLVQDIWL